MGVLTIETNQTVNLSQYGLKAGDLITVTCIGGGAGGSLSGIAYYNSSSYYTHTGANGGDAGCPGMGSSGGGGGAGAGYGAGGGGGANSAGYYNGGGYWKSGGTGGSGGGSGECKMMTHVLNETTVNSLTATIGAGGIGGKWGSNSTMGAATNGGVTSLGTICSANGGLIGRGGLGGHASGGGGQGGYLFPQKLYGGQGGSGGDYYLASTFSVANTGASIQTGTDRMREPVKGCGGGGGASCYDHESSYTCYPVIQFAQTSEFGGAGGKAGQAGGYGVMSKGHGVIIILWD